MMVRIYSYKKYFSVVLYTRAYIFLPQNGTQTRSDENGYWLQHLETVSNHYSGLKYYIHKFVKQ